METKGEGDSIEVTGRTLAAEAVGAAAQDLGAGLIKKPLSRSGKRRQQQLDLGSFVFAGGNVTNRPPSTRRGQVGEAVHEGAGQFSGGEDTLDCVLYVHWPNWDALKHKLEKIKEIAKEIRDGSDHELPLFNGRWVMQAEAIVTKGGGPSYRFAMRSGGVTLAIANMNGPKGDCPNVKVTFGSLVLMTSELRHEWERLCNEIEEFGGELEKSKISRVDGCVDLWGIATALFVERFRLRFFVSRARKFSDNFIFEDQDANAAQVHGTATKDTGFSFGRGMMIRIYDKLEETKRDDVKRQVMIEKRWNGETPEHATRVEFQLRREHLKSMGIDSMADYFERRADVWAYMCDGWFRMTEGAVDRENRNQGTAETWSLWETVRAAFVAWAGAERVEVVRTKLRECNFEALERQAAGCLLSLYAFALGVTNDASEVAAFAWERVNAIFTALPDRELFKRLNRKKDQQDAIIPRSGAIVAV